VEHVSEAARTRIYDILARECLTTQTSVALQPPICLALLSGTSCPVEHVSEAARTGIYWREKI
jgi:hypothetical protein